MSQRQSDEHTFKRFDQELSDLNDIVFRMGGLVEEQIVNAMEALRYEDADAARNVIARDHVVNFLEVQADEQAVNMLALRQPMGRDLRMIMSFGRTVSDLERIGDEAEAIARMTIHMYGESGTTPSHKLLRDTHSNSMASGWAMPRHPSIRGLRLRRRRGRVATSRRRSARPHQQRRRTVPAQHRGQLGILDEAVPNRGVGHPAAVGPRLLVQAGVDVELEDVTERGATRVLVAERRRGVEQHFDVLRERGRAGCAALRRRTRGEIRADLPQCPEMLLIGRVDRRLPCLDRSLHGLHPLESFGDVLQFPYTSLGAQNPAARCTGLGEVMLDERRTAERQSDQPEPRAEFSQPLHQDSPPSLAIARPAD